MRARLPTILACALASVALAADPRPTLKLLSDDELIAFMRDGLTRNSRPAKLPAPHGIVPAGFWSMRPKDAALALVRANRSEESRQYFTDAIKDTDERPPESGAFIFEDRWNLCGYRTVMAYRLEYSPERATLACGRSADITVSDGLNETRRGFDFRETEVPVEKARHLVETIWWLRFVESSWKSENRAAGGGRMSSADGSGFMCLRNGQGKIEFSAKGEIPYDTLGESWGLDIELRAQVGIASLILTDQFLPEIDTTWNTTACCGGAVPGTVIPTRIDPHAPELENLHEIAARWLRRGLENPEVADEPLCTMALEAASHAGWAELIPLAGQIQAHAPLSAAEIRVDAIEEEIAAWKQEHPTLDVDWYKSRRRRDYPDDEATKKERADDSTGAYPGLDKLYAEKDDIEAKRAPNTFIRRKLHDMAGFTVRQLPVANDPAALSAWFVRGEDNGAWAFQRLLQIAPETVPDTLAARLRGGGSEKIPFGALLMLAGIAPERAREVTATWTLDEMWLKGAAGIALSEGRAPRTQWLQHVLAEFDKSGFPDGVFLAVPWQEPLRYDEPELDEALRCLVVTTTRKDDSVKPVREETIYDERAVDAMTALALRHGTGEWPGLCAAWRAVSASRSLLLAPLALVVQAKPDEFGQSFQEMAASPLPLRDRTDVFLAIWAADARGLQPQLEAVSTRAPDDAEVAPYSDAAGQVLDPKYPSHLARKIVALWRERDAATRAKMLLAFGDTEFRDAYEFQTKGLLRRFVSEFATCVRTLDPAQRASVREFIARLEHDDWQKRRWSFWHYAPREMLRAARAELGDH